ncbi:MAG TPA: DUF4349 domain-containing protein, partial [Cyclobacteriaceae bacterium]|nr:DUF4349 domain-containing protein [Cyclobacteriaceae bacterium]
MKPSILILILFLSACESKEEQRQPAMAVSKMAIPETAGSNEVSYVSADSYTPPSDKDPEEEKSGELIMKRADIRFQVQNVEANTRNIEKLVSARKGLIARQNLSTATAQVSNDITIRIPSSAFEELLEDLKKEAQFVDYKRLASENVTEEYMDIQTRLKTKKEVRDRYTEILKTKAKTVEDILKAEEHIRVLQEEIEAKEGRLNFLKSRVSMSVINLEIYQKVIYKEAPALVVKPYVA